MLGTTSTHTTGPTTTMVAVEVMVLLPHGGPASAADAGLWPLLVVVLDDPTDQIDLAVQPLFDLLDNSAGADHITMVASHSQWSALDSRRMFLQLTVHATAPVRFDVTIIIPAGSVPGILDVISRSTSIALTSRRHASTFSRRIRVRDALAEVVLLSGRPSATPAARAAPHERDKEEVTT